MNKVLSPLEAHFEPFRQSTIGRKDAVTTPFGEMPKLYADTTATGLPDSRVEAAVLEIKRQLANTHTTSNFTGDLTTQRYHFASCVIKEHVHANDDDVLITEGSGMTAAINKLVRLMGLYLPPQWKERVNIPEAERPVVFITHMEHHSNILPWEESIAEVVMLDRSPDGTSSPEQLAQLCKRYAPRPLIGSFTAASNVTGIRTPYRDLSRVLHQHGGVCVVDFAASAPYDRIDMHPDDENERIDAVVFSPHKFQGGVETPGVLVANKALMKNTVPDRPGGGTVEAVDRWGGRWYVPEHETREDGGTPAIIGRMRAALAIVLKQNMGEEQIALRERELISRFMDGMAAIDGTHVFEAQNRNRLGIVSFYMDGVPHGLLAALLNDRFGIQVRNGCSCAGPYGHVLLDITRERSAEIIRHIVDGDASAKPGWVRVSLHPTMLNDEVDQILCALREIRSNIDAWKHDYTQVEGTTDFVCKRGTPGQDIESVFLMNGRRLSSDGNRDS